MNILFFVFKYQPDRNATLIDEVVMRDAIREAILHPRQELMGTESRKWYASMKGSIGEDRWTLAIEPFKGMTWGMCTDALIGLNRFVQERPGWDFRFLLEPRDRVSRLLGTGGLYWALF